MLRAPARPIARAVLAVALAAPGALHANGRFPSSNYFVAGPGPGSAVLALRTTFGLVVSEDGGRTWGWNCEEALDSVGTFDPSVAVGFDGAIVVGTQTGLRYSRDGCGWAMPRGNPTRGIVDVANDATGRFLVTATGPTGTDDTLILSNDGGASWSEGARMPGLFTETVEVAPSRTSRIYVSGFLRGGVAILLRSDDGGMTTREATRDFRGGTSAFVSGVDPTNPDVVYVRSSVGLGTALLRSDDGGASFRELTRTTYDMVGFALSDDGRTVWVASSDRAEGILRSVGGAPFSRVAATVSARCLRYHAGVLYVCADEGSDGYVLGCSTDGGDRVDPLLSARLLTGPSASCAPGSPVSATCGPLWPRQLDMLRAIDAGAPPAPVRHDAAVPAVDAPPDGPSDAAADLHDAAADDPAVGADVAPDRATVDAATPDAVVDAAPAPVDVAPVDVATDAALDAEAPRDAASPADRGPAGATPSCGCRAGGRASGGAGLAGLALLALLARRRRNV